MRYVELNEAVRRVKETKTSDVLKGICDYAGGANEKNVATVLTPILELLGRSEKENKPIFCNWRNIATSQFESWIIEDIARKKSGISVWFTYTGDIFSKNNPDKIIFEKIKRFTKKGENVKTIHLCYSLKNKEGKLFSEIITQCGLELAEYHLRMRKRVGFSNENIIDLGQIFKDLFYLSSKPIIEKFSNGSGMPKKEWCYPILMMLSSKLIFLEDFEVCDGEMKKIVDESCAQALDMGFNPNFVHLKALKVLDWYMTELAPEGVPPEIEKIIEEIINNINDP